MSPPVASKTDPFPAPGEGPSEESFDEKYNKRLEFPISLVSAVLIHVLVGATLVVLLFYVLADGNDQSSVPVTLIQFDGNDDIGAGAAGSGAKAEDAFFKTDVNLVTVPTLPDPLKLPEVKEDVPPAIKIPERSDKLPVPKTQGFSRGIDNGKGHDNSPGPGPGGVGADSTYSRNLRWVLRFKVVSGQDYLEQLKAMGAEIIVPISDSEKYILISDLHKPNEQKTASEQDLKRLANKIKFCDTRPEAVRQVVRVLGLENVSSKEFWAFFPKELEEELSRKELSHRNRRSEDIAETIFRVVVRDGKYEIHVDDQTIKK